MIVVSRPTGTGDPLHVVGYVDRHVVAVGYTVVGIEALGQREELSLMPQMPLAHAGRCVAFVFQGFGMDLEGKIKAAGQEGRIPP